MKIENLTMCPAAVAAALLVWSSAMASGAPAVAPQPPKGPPSRFLLVVETSAPMQKRIQGLSSVLQELLTSGMHGQMRAGDTLGVWTYNAGVYTGRLPLQTWTDYPKGVATTVMHHVAAQTFEKQPSLEKVLPAMLNVAKNSESLTIVLVSTGAGTITGTPFDEPVNAYYSTWNSQQHKSKMPFVTVLRGARGKLSKYAVNTAPFPVEIPPLERPALLAKAPASTTKPAALAVTPTVGAPLIVIGKKPQPAEPLKVAAAITAAPSESDASVGSEIVRPETGAASIPTRELSMTVTPAQPAVTPNSSTLEPSARTKTQAQVPSAYLAPTETPRASEPKPAPAPALTFAQPPRGWFDPVLGLILLTAFMTGGGIVAWFIFRQHRPEVSLITRSLQLSSKP